MFSRAPDAMASVACHHAASVPALLLPAFLLVAPTTALAQTVRPTVSAVRVDAPIHVDGNLDEAAWQNAAPAHDF
ncbi:MAG: hypothetical protein LJF06_02200, partial [Gemmatimonadetes bacterium]|nr:hypothetical protein [Gemmatimonadota bacterium]